MEPVDAILRLSFTQKEGRPAPLKLPLGHSPSHLLSGNSKTTEKDLIFWKYRLLANYLFFFWKFGTRSKNIVGLGVERLPVSLVSFILKLEEMFLIFSKFFLVHYFPLQIFLLDK